MENQNVNKFSVDLGGMISILSENLYSKPDVFLRELIQNAADAISMRRDSDPDFAGENGGVSGEIDITVRPGKSITFRDNGIGLTEDEIRRFVAVIGSSSKRGPRGSYIGRFGIGLLSCFIVTNEIVLRSRSAKMPGVVSEWHGFADGRWSVRQTNSDMPVGSEISFLCSSPDNERFFDEEFIADRARYYALPLPYPIYVGTEGGARTRANLLYVGNTRDTRKMVMETGRRVFGTDTDFLDYIPLESPSGLFSGAAYILPYTVSAAGSAKRHRIYLKNMLLTEDGTGLLPEWAFFVRCFINSEKLRPTASREELFRDGLLDQAREEISLCIVEYLEKLSFSDPAMLARIGELHGTALRSIACENERIFRIFMPYFRFETSLGVMPITGAAEHGKTVFFTSDTDTFRQLRPIFAEQGILLVNTGYVHEKDLLLFADRLGLLHAEPLRENIIAESLNDCPDEESFGRLIKAFCGSLEEFGCRAVMKSFSPPQLTCLYSANADEELRREIEHSKENGDGLFADMLDAFGSELEDTASAILYLNGSNDLVRRLSDVEDSEKLNVFARILYVQALIAGGFPVRAMDMSIMNENLIRLIEWGI
jgi:molecular chaperone HtpG